MRLNFADKTRAAVQPAMAERSTPMIATNARAKPRALVTDAEIAERAYELWRARGCPPSDGREDWFAARALLLAEKQREAPPERAPVVKNALRMLSTWRAR
jgi:hypothetical protein